MAREPTPRTTRRTTPRRRRGHLALDHAIGASDIGPATSLLESPARGRRLRAVDAPEVGARWRCGDEPVETWDVTDDRPGGHAPQQVWQAVLIDLERRGRAARAPEARDDPVYTRPHPRDLERAVERLAAG